MWKLMNLSRNKMHVTVAEFKTFATHAGPSSPLTGILAQAFAEPSFQSRPASNRGGRLSSQLAVASLRVGLPPEARCGIHDDVVDTLGLGEHGHMA